MADQVTRRSAVIAPIDLPPAIERLRYAEVADARAGVPAHVTLLFPFLEPPAIDDRLLVAVATALHGVGAFDVEFGELRRWSPDRDAPLGVLWLVPEPSEPFQALTQALWDAFPDHPPYEGGHDEVVPHLTLATDDWSRFDAIAGEATRHLPFGRRVDAAALFVEGFDGQWQLRGRFALGPPDGSGAVKPGRGGARSRPRRPGPARATRG